MFKDMKRNFAATINHNMQRAAFEHEMMCDALRDMAIVSRPQHKDALAWAAIRHQNNARAAYIQAETYRESFDMI